jgi:hypothetical protein
LRADGDASDTLGSIRNIGKCLAKGETNSLPPILWTLLDPVGPNVLHRIFRLAHSLQTAIRRKQGSLCCRRPDINPQ